MHRYKCWNAAMPTTAAMSAVATGTSIKTMLQIATPSTRQIQLISWGYTLSTLPGAVGTIELIQTDVAATVTAHVAAGVQPLDPNAPPSLMTLGTSATGFTATVEGSITATRVFDTDQIPIASGEVPLNYDYQWMPDERPIIAVSKFLRVRATTPTSGVNMLTWVCWDE
jgi:hypothetical protein